MHYFFPEVDFSHDQWEIYRLPCCLFEYRIYI